MADRKQTVQAAIQEMVARIVAQFQPERIILFGSQARGDAGPDSDVDLLILQREVPQPHEAMAAIYAALAGIGVPVDVVVMTTERFEESKDVIGGLAYPANRYGKVLYAVA